MAWKGFKDVQATIIIDLKNKGQEDLWKEVEKSRRKNISRASSSGLEFKEANEEEWQEYYKIYNKVWKEGGVNPEPIEKLKRENYKLFVAKKEGKVLGGGLIEMQEKGINFVAFASSIEHQLLRVNDFLYWSSILYALNSKMEYVDLGGYQLKAKGHMQGINRFKEQWGGKLVEKEVKGSPIYLLGRKAIRNIPLMRKLWDIIKRRPLAKNKKQ